VPVPIDEDLYRNWRAFDPSFDWRHLGMTPRFPVTATTAMDMWSAVGQPDVQGVLAVDVIALQALLEITGPIEVDGEQITADGVVELVMHDQYLESFGDPDQTYEEFEQAQGDRRDRLSAVAEAAIDAFDADPDVGLDELEPLADAARGRHILAWSPDPEVGPAFIAAGIDGGLEDDSLSLGVINRSGVKLDWYTRVESEMQSDDAADGRQVTVRVKVRNEAPSNEPPYVIGPYPNSGLAPRDYLAIVALTVPGTAQDLRITSGHELMTNGRDGRHRVIGARVLVPGGSEDTVELTFRLPPDADALRVEASARAEGVQWTYGDQRWRDLAARSVGL
jgi:hypothetical protein